MIPGPLALPVRRRSAATGPERRPGAGPACPAGMSGRAADRYRRGQGISGSQPGAWHAENDHFRSERGASVLSV
ncbi:hypothetical protein M2169_003110 [Streptomyces sp. MJP52]|nr:hypothetical protein [Streptomyces sp. MJP52]